MRAFFLRLCYASSRFRLWPRRAAALHQVHRGRPARQRQGRRRPARRQSATASRRKELAAFRPQRREHTCSAASL